MIRLLEENDLTTAIDIVSLAYPGMNIQTPESKKDFVNRLINEQKQRTDVKFFGYFKQEEMIGVYRVSEFACNVNGEFQRVFGLGMVAVHLLHKKEKVAFQMLSNFHAYARQEGVALVSLYPFNPSFYRKMGYGYGPLKYEFRLIPHAFKGGAKEHVTFLSPADEDDIVSLYDRYAKENHGMFKRTWVEKDRIKNAATNYVGVYEGEILVGALAFTLQPVKDSHFLHQHMIVHEWIWTTPRAFQQLASWLSSQQDQVERIIIRTHDKSFLYSLEQPLNDSNHLIPSVNHEVATTGAGIMYRIVHIPSFVQAMNDQQLRRPNENTRILLEVKDSFLGEQDGIFELRYHEQCWTATKIETTEAAHVSIRIGDLSAWWMGCVSITELIKYGQVVINKLDSHKLDEWFKPTNSPICYTSF